MKDKLKYGAIVRNPSTAYLVSNEEFNTGSPAKWHQISRQISWRSIGIHTYLVTQLDSKALEWQQQWCWCLKTVAPKILLRPFTYTWSDIPTSCSFCLANHINTVIHHPIAQYAMKRYSDTVFDMPVSWYMTLCFDLLKHKASFQMEPYVVHSEVQTFESNAVNGC